MEKTYKFRLCPSKQQINIFNNVLDSCRFLYNQQIEYEKYVYGKNKTFVSRFDLNNLLPDLKIIYPKLKKIHSQVLCDINFRVINAFKRFFDMVKKGQKVGYPRFKNRYRYNSFTYTQSGFKIGNKLKLSKIGEISIKLHRTIKGTIKTLTIIRTSTNKWFACFSTQQDISPPKRQPNKVIGIDLGLDSFATLSDGTIIDNPRKLKESLEKLRFLSKRLSRKKKDSKNREKARFKLAKLYESVSNQRLDFLHKITSKLVTEYDCIALEDLKPSEMKNKYLQFSINDASWYKFRELLTYKAEEAGCKLDFVEPRGTSKKCSKCGKLQDMPLSKREYVCSCGNSISRDFNSSLNILHQSSFFHNLPSDRREVTPVGDVPLGTSMNQESIYFSM